MHCNFGYIPYVYHIHLLSICKFKVLLIIVRTYHKYNILFFSTRAMWLLLGSVKPVIIQEKGFLYINFYMDSGSSTILYSRTGF